MRALVQRVERASVITPAGLAGSIRRGLLVFLGVTHSDTTKEAASLARKVAGLRIFEDAEGKMNLGLGEIGGAVLCVSQFTLYGDVRRGNRPSFIGAAPPAEAERLYLAFCDAITAASIPCERGVFGAHMRVELVNDGPVTLWLDTDDLAGPRRA